MIETSAITRHWTLNLAREMPAKVSDLLPSVKQERLNVLKVPGVSATEYASALLNLFDSGAIQARLLDDEDRSPANRPDLEAVLEARLQLPPIPETSADPRRANSGIRSALGRDSPDLAWELTLLGGEEWETLALPDWNRFANILSDEVSGEIWSSNHDLLMAELGWCRELTGLEIDRTSIQIEMLSNHAVTYWKILPEVYHAAFRSKDVNNEWTAKPLLEPHWFRKWWLSRHDWYTKPWNLPGWPKVTNEPILTGEAHGEEETFVFAIKQFVTGGFLLEISYSGDSDRGITGGGIWPSVDKAKEIAQQTAVKMLKGTPISWDKGTSSTKS